MNIFSEVMRTMHVKKIVWGGLLPFFLLFNTACFASGESDVKALTKEEAQATAEDLMAERSRDFLAAYESDWDRGVLEHDGYSMPFYATVFGDAPSSGRSMVISLHGGGGAPSYVNDEQWENQKYLYQLDEGLYFVPRAPTDTWDLWHQSYMDGFIEKAIALAVLKEGVNPRKVYLMGYSAGGDGTYQLATRMPDLFAGAAMSAGHPGDARIENLYNLPFGIYMGGQDSAYDRNLHAADWGNRLDQLTQDSGGAYPRDVRIFPYYGHWMEGEDAVSIPWMKQYIRASIPYEVYWIQDDVLRDNFYWLSTVDESKYQNATINVFYNDEESFFYIRDTTNVDSFIININDEMCDLDKSITIYRNDRAIFEGVSPRTENNIKKDIEAMRDSNFIFPAKILINGMDAQIVY